MNLLPYFLDPIDLVCVVICAASAVLDLFARKMTPGSGPDRWRVQLDRICWPAILTFLVSGLAWWLVLDKGDEMVPRVLILIAFGLAQYNGGGGRGGDDDDPDDDDDDDPTGRKVEPEPSIIERIGDRLRVAPVPAPAGA